MKFEKEFEIAQKVISRASAIVMKYYKKGLPFVLKKDNSLLTEADVASERFIKSELLKTFPEYGFIGEETAGTEKEIAWILDPLDGTRSFAAHIPEFGIALALKKGNDLICSVISLPLYNSMLTAYAGTGAFENGRRLTVSNTLTTDSMLTSIGMQNFWMEEYADYTKKVMQSVKNKMHVGLSSAVESYYLASGKIDVFIRLNQPIWDIAAQYLLMRESGAVVSDISGKTLQLGFSKKALHNCVAVNQYLAENAKDILFCND